MGIALGGFGFALGDEVGQFGAAFRAVGVVP
jgi:hypothetical protein